MAKSDLIRLKHMLVAAYDCLEFVDKKKRKDFESDKMLIYATIRALEIFGEAAAKISKSFQNKNPQIKWRAIIGMRNRLIHAYFDIDYDIVWQAIKSEIPTLIHELENLINNLEKEAANL